MDSFEIRAGAALLVAFVAAAWDIGTRRIPNELTFGAAGMAVAYALY